jgi:hypothetical protein
MSKIIQVVNIMISNSEKISNVLTSNNSEFYFVYNNKYKWSIVKNSDETIRLFLYPDENKTLEELAYDTDFSFYNKIITYSSVEYKSKEATESFNELYNIISSKVLGADNILDDILNE